MGLLDVFKRHNPVGGEIGYRKLNEWWSTAFTNAERSRIMEVFRPLGSGNSALLEGNILSSSQSTLSFLTDLAGWFKKDCDRPIGYKILAKAEQLVPSSTSVLDRHFFYQAKIEMYYADRNDPRHLVEAEYACRSQIAISNAAAKAFAKEYPGALPEHKGYNQLTIILHDRGARVEAIEIARRALSEGWSGDWPKRIERYSRQ